jgi:hypothetical protein
MLLHAPVSAIIFNSSVASSLIALSFDGRYMGLAL